MSYKNDIKIIDINLLEKRLKLLKDLKDCHENALIHYYERCLLENEQHLRNYNHPLLKNLFVCFCDYHFNQQHVDKIKGIIARLKTNNL